MYQWVKPRSLLLHLALVVVAGGCLYAGWWQVHRAMAGNTLSYLYSVEWPAFAVVAGIGWWLMVHDTPEDIARRKQHHAAVRAATAEVVARTLPRSALAITVGSSEGAERALDPAESTLAIGAGRSGDGREPSVALSARPAPLVVQGQGDAALLGAEEDPDDDDLAAYNRYLALLAVRGKPKTWRNPHGI
ncbi:MAG: hypothetical protein ACRDYY_03235 [Acidimicrobiales bacterium]